MIYSNNLVLLKNNIMKIMPDTKKIGIFWGAKIDKEILESIKIVFQQKYFLTNVENQIINTIMDIQKNEISCITFSFSPSGESPCMIAIGMDLHFKNQNHHFVSFSRILDFLHKDFSVLNSKNLANLLIQDIIPEFHAHFYLYNFNPKLKDIKIVVTESMFEIKNVPNPSQSFFIPKKISDVDDINSFFTYLKSVLSI